jgi:TonB-dependent starch-binding outer membrane protein SusC
MKIANLQNDGLRIEFPDNFVISSCRPAGFNYIRGVKQIFFTVVLLLTAFIQTGHAAPNRLITLSKDNAPLETVFDEIQKQAGITFFYDKQVLSASKPVDVHVTNAQVADVLEHCLAGQSFSYVLIKDEVFIKANLNGTVFNVPPLTVEGKVSNASGAGIQGVSVALKGSSIGTNTNEEGRYTINIPDGNGILIFSSIGFTSQEIEVMGRSTIDVILSEVSKELTDVVVVGYGTQKKINLTGAVSTVNKDLIKRRTVTQASQLLQGATSGVSVIQGSGLPGSDGASITIRGISTFSGAGRNPLVLVDGVPSSINSVSPNDIESISILKDAASASIYGSRAANGVILITTKVGAEGKLSVNYDAYVGKQEATELPQYVDSWTYAEMMNEARNNMGISSAFTQGDIDKFRSGNDPDNYPNKHHVRDLFTSGTGLQTRHNLSVNGSQGGTRYLFSAGYLQQDGIVEKTGYERYDFRLNLNSKVAENLKLDVKLAGNFSNQNKPGMMTTENAIGGFDAILRAAASANATEAGEKSDGTYGTHMGHAVAIAGINSASFDRGKNSYFMNNFLVEWNILKSLKLSTRLAYDLNFGRTDNFASIFTWDNQTVVRGPSKLQATTSHNANLTWDSYLDYEKNFSNDHYFHLLGGFSHIKNKFESLGAYRENSPSTELHVINAFAIENASNSGGASTTKLNSFFSRANYRFRDKYMLEGNLRYDGSSRFSRETRFGLFPSFSAAWIVSKENFFNVAWVDNLKIRSSYGTLGNQEIGNYPYQRTLNLNQSYPFGETERLLPGITLTTLPFETITWEKVTAFNQGVDVTLLNGRFSFSIDHYNRLTSDILQSLTVSSVLGRSISAQNAGKVENRGWEFELTYRETIKDLSFSFQPNFSINKNKVLSLGGVDRDINRGLFVGQPLGSIYGYRTDGLFIDQQDIDTYAVQNYTASPGLIRYVDISGPDGKPDGKISAEYDRTIIGTTSPKYSYGISVRLDYKSFDFFMQSQGLAGFEKRISGTQLAFFNNGNIEQWQVDNRWTKGNPNRAAIYPKLVPLSSSPEVPFGPDSEYWLRSASFVRLKTLQLGYTIPSQIIGKTFIRNFRVYLSGENVLTLDNYYQGWDPEMGTGGYANSSYYPPTRLWTFGVNVNF